MKKDNPIFKIFNRFRTKPRYYSTGGKVFYKRQLKKIIISIVIILIILIIKLIDAKETNEVIRLVQNTVNNDFNFREDSKKVIEFAKKITDISKETATVFNNNNEVKREYIFPVANGVVYRNFGNEIKGANIKVFYKGIDILTKDNKIVAIGDGIVIETGENGILGKYVKIDHDSIQSIYGYLEKINVTAGERVMKGQIIGNLGSIDKERNLLHLEIWENNTPINPLHIVNIPFNESSIK